jgi:hypothetical protein
MRHLLDSVQGSNIIQCIDTGRQASVEAEDLVVDQGGEGEVVEQVGEVLPHIGIAVLPETLVVESVYLCDLARLVVAAENGDAAGISDLERHEEGDGLDRVVTAVNIIA